MLFFVHVLNYNKKTQAYTKVIDPFSDEGQALVRFHNAMKDGISNENVAWCNTIITNQYGVISKNEYWEEPNVPSV